MFLKNKTSRNIFNFCIFWKMVQSDEIHTQTESTSQFPIIDGHVFPIIFVSNPISVSGEDDALKCRFRIIPFDSKFI